MTREQLLARRKPIKDEYRRKADNARIFVYKDGTARWFSTDFKYSAPLSLNSVFYTVDRNGSALGWDKINVAA